jgi:hypothetical protein
MRNYVTVIFMMLVFLAGSLISERGSLQAAEYDPQSAVNSIYYTGFNSPMMLASDSGKNSSSVFSDFDLGSVHKILGYTTIATALTAMVAGIMMANAYDNNKKPSSTLSSVHRVSAAGTVGLAIGSCTTGVLAFSDMISFKDGVNSYNSHASLAVLSTLGFVLTAAITPESENRQGSRKKNYTKHATAAGVSGGLLLGTAIVIHF